MIDLGTTDFYIAVPSLPQQEFENYSTQVFDEWDAYVEKTLALSDYSLALEVEEGSINARGKIAAAAGALYIGIGMYGSFVSGLQTIHDQTTSVGKYLVERGMVPFAHTGVQPKIRKHGGSLAYLNRLYVKVQRGELTTEQAMREAETHFGDEVSDAPEFMRGLEASLNEAPKFHQQLPLTLHELGEEDLLPSTERERTPRPSQPRPNLPPPPHFRVEVWRESKQGQRQIRVVQL